jgi:hypothetical protein
VGRKRLTKIHQILLVKIAKLGGEKWGNEFGSGLARVAFSEGGRWVVVVGGEFGWKYPRLSLAHTLICAGDNVSPAHRHLFTGDKVYRWRITYVFARGKNHPGRGGPSHLIPGAY